MPEDTSRTSRGFILDALPDAVLLVKDGHVVDANESARGTFADGGELNGLPLAQLLRDGEWERLLLMEAQHQAGGPAPTSCRLRFTRKTGTSLLADVRWRALPASELVITARDMTEVTRAETLMGRLAHLPSGLDGALALLTASEPIFSELHWRVAFTEIVPDGSITRRMIAPRGDPVGDYGRSLVGRQIPREETPVLAEVVRTGEPIFLDNLPTATRGAPSGAVTLSESMQRAGTAPSAWCPIRVGGKVAYLLAVTGQDLTAHDFVAVQLFSAQLAAALRLQALRLEMVHRERLAAVGEMAAVLAHEVRNPLGVMFTALGTLRRSEPPEGATWPPLLAILQEEAERLDRLVNDLLEFSTSPAPVLEPLAVGPVVRDALQAAQHDPAYVAAKPKVSVVVSDDDLVHTDRVLLRRVLVNILLNAFQHVRSSGRVDIRSSHSSSHVALTISNDGATH